MGLLTEGTAEEGEDREKISNIGGSIGKPPLSHKKLLPVITTKETKNINNYNNRNNDPLMNSAMSLQSIKSSLSNDGGKKDARDGAKVVVEELQNSIANYINKTEALKKTMILLDDQLKKLQRSITSCRIRLGGVQALKINEQFVAKQISIMENRILKSRRDYMQEKATAQDIRLEIDRVRRERNIQKERYIDTEKEYKSISKRIETLERAIHEREKLTLKLIDKTKKYKVMAASEYSSLANVWMEVGEEVKEASKHNRKRNHVAPTHIGTLTLEQENNIKLANRLSDWQALCASSSSKRAKAKLAFLRENFGMLTKALNLTAVDEVLEMISKLEIEKLSLFHASNDILQQQKEAKEEIIQLKIRTDSENTSLMESDKSKSSVLKMIKDKTDLNNKKSSKMAKKYGHDFEKAKNIRNALESIFLMIKMKGNDDDLQLDISTTRNGRTEETPITVGNMNQYLGILELKVNDIIRSYVQESIITSKDLKKFALKRRASSRMFNVINSVSSATDTQPQVKDAEKLLICGPRVNNPSEIKIDPPTVLSNTKKGRRVAVVRSFATLKDDKNDNKVITYSEAKQETDKIAIYKNYKGLG